MTKTVLAIFAHPDDEAFGCAGTFARVVRNGGTVTLVCATRGEVGMIREGAIATRETLGAVRETELRTAMGMIGVNDVRFLDYRDSGMSGSDENAHPDAFINQSEPIVSERLAEIINEVRPSVVLTFGPDGIYGHPDHLMAHRTATAAFNSATLAAQAALYYNAISRERIKRMAERTDGPFRDLSAEQLDAMGIPEAEITTSIDVSELIDLKLAVIRAHRTQVAPDGPFDGFDPTEVRSMLAIERFRQVSPPFVGDTVDTLKRLAGEA